MLPFPYLVFQTVIDQGTFNKAAAVLNVTPSAISHSVNQLETELGFPVFVRSRNGVRLTPDGEKILPLIQEIINDQSRLEQVAQQIQGLDTGLIRIGAFSSVCINWLPPLIRNFAKNYPQVKISVRQAGFSEITQAVKSGQLDLGLTMLPENEQGISCEKILEDEIYCIAPKDFQVKNGHSISEERPGQLQTSSSSKATTTWIPRPRLTTTQLSQRLLAFPSTTSQSWLWWKRAWGWGSCRLWPCRRCRGKSESCLSALPFTGRSPW